MDNGTNFVGAERELNELILLLNDDPKLVRFRIEKSSIGTFSDHESLILVELMKVWCALPRELCIVLWI
jgi:hypothetical protein